MFCSKCGNQLQDGAKFCDACGNQIPNNNTGNPPNQPQESEQVDRQAQWSAGFNNTPVQATSQYHSPMQPTMQSPINTNWTDSYFDGGLMGLIGVNLAVAFISFITLGLAWPALCCFKLRWIYKHTVVGGYRLNFNGKGGQLFGKYLLWILLTIVTLTIYAWWLPIKYKKWEVSHIVIDSMIPNNRY